MKNDNLKLFLCFFLCFCLSLAAVGDEVTVDGIRFEIADGKATVIGLRYKDLATVVIPAEANGVPVTSIGNWAFGYCEGLTSVTLPASLTAIGEGAFCGCTSLSSLTIPDGVTSIGDAAFEYCKGMTSVTLPASLTSIGDYAFRGSGLTSVSLPASLTSIGEVAFSYCYSLTDFVVLEGNENFVVVDGVLFNAGMTALLAYPAGKTGDTYAIPEGATSIGDGAFAGCEELSSITLPASLTSIGDYAFYSCYSLPSISIPEGVTSIGDGAFSGCYSLSGITIPEGVTSIGDYAFYSC